MASPGDNAKPLSPGDRWRPTADGLNSWNEAAQYVRGLRDDSGALATPAAMDSPAIVLVKNQSGSDRTRFDVLGVDGVLITPSDNLAVFSSRRPLVGVLPSVADHAGRFCVLLEPVATGKLGRALFLGVVPARVYVNSHLDAYCDVMESKTIGDETVYLGSGSSGAQILWWEAADLSAVGTVVWAVLRLGGAGGGLRCFEVSQSSPAAPAAPGSSVDAWTLRWNATTQHYDDPNRSDPTDLVVIDTEGRFRWLCYDDTEQDAPGSRGFCDSNGVIVSIHEPSKLLGGSVQVTSAFVVTGLTSLYALDGGLLPKRRRLPQRPHPSLAGWSRPVRSPRATPSSSGTTSTSSTSRSGSTGRWPSGSAAPRPALSGGGPAHLPSPASRPPAPVPCPAGPATRSPTPATASTPVWRSLPSGTSPSRAIASTTWGRARPARTAAKR